MKWFEGSINEAVATSKSRKAIFVVFVAGKDDTSVKVAEAINATEVSCRLERDDFVAIRLETGSETYRLFAQIYQLVPVPSIFFIGENGTPLEIIADSTTAADLASKIDVVLSKAGKNKNASMDLINAEQIAANASSSNVKTNADQKADSSTAKSNVEKVPLTQSKPENESNNIKDEPSTSLRSTELPKPVSETNKAPTKELTPEEQVKQAQEIIKGYKNKVEEEEEKKENEREASTKELTPEEKVERAQRIIEEYKKQRKEEEEKKEREREIERRKIGRDVQKMRQKQQDLEVKLALETRMKEKAADAAAREKVLQQIAQDKLERKQRELAKQQHMPPPSNPEPSEQNKQTISTATVSRIQFRFPSGNPYIGQFEPTNTLRDLRTYVVQNINLPFQQFAMSTFFPRRELLPEDDDKTLLELELVPTAVILILPLKNSGASTAIPSAQNSVAPRFIWSIFAVFTAVYYYIVGYFTGGGHDDTPKPPSTSVENKDTENNAGGSVASTVQNVGSSSGLVRRYLGNRGTTTIKTEGNIHRLHSDGDDNDENNTWNEF
ncbi:UBX domain-containing protein 4 [Anthophora plagiata]